jgi:hypothetical protein
MTEASSDPTGLLWAINRIVFHPRGLALAFHFDDGDTIMGWSVQGDGSEPFAFATEDDDLGHARFAVFLASLGTDRLPDTVFGSKADLERTGMLR